MTEHNTTRRTGDVELSHKAALAMDEGMTAAKNIVDLVMDNQANAHDDVQFTSEMIDEDFKRADEHRKRAHKIGDAILSKDKQ
jgi:hypothetical protein